MSLTVRFRELPQHNGVDRSIGTQEYYIFSHGVEILCLYLFLRESMSHRAVTRNLFEEQFA